MLPSELKKAAEKSKSAVKSGEVALEGPANADGDGGNPGRKPYLC